MLTAASRPVPATPQHKPRVTVHDSRPIHLVHPSLEPLPDLSHAMTAPAASKLPSTAEQYRRLKGAIVKNKPAVDTAKARSDRLKEQARALQRRLIDTAARVQSLERQMLELDADIEKLTAQYKVLSAGFVRDRVVVARLLAVIERLQHDTPPAMVMRPDDALGAARGAMLIGASLPDVYGQAAALAHRIESLQQTRYALLERRAEAVRTAKLLGAARTELDQLLATKQAQAQTAAAIYSNLKAKLDVIAAQAESMEALLARVAALRSRPAQQSVMVVTAQNAGSQGADSRGSLLLPVVGAVRQPSGDAGHGPGVTFLTSPGAQVVAPADCEVLFAGPYHKSGQVLILEVTVGYDLVLAGMARTMVRPGDLVLAGEPVGAMPQMGQDGELYFELRRHGHGASPAALLGLDSRKAKRS